MRANFPFVGGFNRYEGINFDCEDTVNLFVIKDNEGKKTIGLLNTAGIGNKQTVKNDLSVMRQLFVCDNILFGVCGSSVYRFDNNLNKNHLGELLTQNGYVSISCNNGNQVLFIDGAAGYVYNINTGVFGQVTSTSFPGLPLNGVFFDTYFVIPSANSQQFQLSANNDGTMWNAVADQAQIQVYPGFLMGVGGINKRLYFFKNDSTEIWYDAGASDFPLRPDNNLIFNYGCLATSSIASDYGYLFWLSSDKSGAASVMMTTGSVPKPVSNFAVEYLISTFTDPSDVQTWIYKDSSHIFYVMSFNTDDYTLVYDVTTNEWHRMEMEPDSVTGKSRHIASCHAYFNGKHYVGSYKGPYLYEFSRNFAANDTEIIRRERTAKPFFDPDGYRKLQINKFQIDIQPGIGDADGIYKNPNAYLSVSKDGGQRFGNRQPAAIGAIGQSKVQVFWRKKGLARSFVPRATFYASVAPIMVMGAAIDFEVLDK